MDFKEYSIDKFLYELKTDLPSPGGGSTAALVSALAGALNSMVYSFTVDKKVFEKLDDDKKEKMRNLKNECENFINKSMFFMEEDRNTFTTALSIALCKSIADTIASEVKFLFPYSTANSIFS